MSLLHIVIILVVVIGVMWAVNYFIPMPPKVKAVLNTIVAVIVVLWILDGLGMLNWLTRSL